VHQRPQDEFTGKIVLIGSTAPSLFDLRPTPVSRAHPGVEILATAIDNLEHRDYLRSPEGRVLNPLLALLIVWATAWSFYRNAGREKIDALFGASQFILLGFSYASINFTNTYINLTGPVTVGIAFFTIARLYAAATDRELELSAVRYAVEHTGDLWAGLLLIRVEGAGEKELERLRRRLAGPAGGYLNVELVKGRQRGVWGLLENLIAISWVLKGADCGSQIEREAQTLTARLAESIAAMPGATASWQLQQGPISGGERAREAWQRLLAEGLLGQSTKVPGGSTMLRGAAGAAG
jgi:hypothetical protein